MTLGQFFYLSFTLVSSSAICKNINRTYITGLLSKEIVCEEVKYVAGS